ncbi:MAG: Uma2 family endonuclease [Candidatus Tectomicrobia bacterium]|nr:Uma2 family endonuclease [Candidatus Tectomicrobia bacterium]
MAINPKTKLTPAEYLAFERAQTDAKHEYCDGEIHAMAGASREHNRIVSNVMGMLYNQLRGRPCDHYSGDMRVKVPATGLYVYPDVTALCDEPQFEDEVLDTLLNPSVIIEVLSETTEAYDRGAKFDHYRSIESLQAYILIAQDKPQIELFQRQTDNWLLSVAKGVEAGVRLEAIDCELVLADVYERVL